jgi:hypothetical protein
MEYDGSVTSTAMIDLIFIGVTLAFFALAIAYAWFCKKVR